MRAIAKALGCAIDDFSDSPQEKAPPPGPAARELLEAAEGLDNGVMRLLAEAARMMKGAGADAGLARDARQLAAAYSRLDDGDQALVRGLVASLAAKHRPGA
jgi:hypothetical protein